MPTEIEAKIKITEQEADFIRRRLSTADSITCGVERNSYYDSESHNLDSLGKCLRIRAWTPDGGNWMKPAGNWMNGRSLGVLTFKGPILGGPFKSREETEVVFDPADGEKMAEILRALGYHQTITYLKRREKHLLGNTEICLDYIESLGWFVEVEAHTEDEVARMVKMFGLSDRPVIKDGYPKLIADNAEKNRVSD